MPSRWTSASCRETPGRRRFASWRTNSMRYRWRNGARRGCNGRLEPQAWSWFDKMTEEEKAAFIEATMPTGFKQMLTSFEQLPDDKRRKTIDDALKRLKEARDQVAGGTGGPNQGGTNSPPVLSDELQAKVRTIG